MALIMYLTKAPRYQNIMTGEYETIPRDDIALIEKYFNWNMAREDGGKYSCDTLEEWCGIPESQLPHKYVVNYYGDFFTEKETYSEMLGVHKRYCIFEHLFRIAKANQIFAWFIKNVMNGNMDNKYYEVSREQLLSLYNACKTVVHSDVETAKNLLPLMDNSGYFFGTDSYNEVYTNQIISMIDALKKIIKNTDFEKETVYFNAIW